MGEGRLSVPPLRIVTPHGERADLAAVDAAEVRAMLAESGALLLRGFGPDVAAFSAFADRFISQRVVHPGSRDRITADDTVQSVTQGDGAVELHAELASTPMRPDLIWFYCERPCASGGQTTVCDGVALFEALSAATRELFTARRIQYRAVYERARWERMFGTSDRTLVTAALSRIPNLAFELDGEDRIHSTYVTSALVRSKTGAIAYANSIRGPYDHQVELEGGARIPEEALDEVRHVGDALTLEVSWQAGDVVMIDNLRVMHGRRAFSSPIAERRIFAKLGSAGGAG